jgi:hypothetical protein
VEAEGYCGELLLTTLMGISEAFAHVVLAHREVSADLLTG